MRMGKRNILTADAGNIGLTAALVLPLVVLSIGLGVDYAYLSLQRRQMQSVADITAIVAAADMTNRQAAVLDHLRSNNLDLLLSTPAGLEGADGPVLANDPNSARRGIISMEPGRYVPDPTIRAGQRFIKNATPTDAVRISIRKEGELFVAQMFASPPVLDTDGTAASAKVASFSVGSRLASLNGGLLNAILGQMLGTTVSLKVMDYTALVDADIDIQPFLKGLATNLHLTAATYDDVLQADITLPQMLTAMRAVDGLLPATTSALKALQGSAAKNDETFTLAQIINIDPKKALRIDAGSDWKMQVSALQMISAAAALANGRNQIALDAGIGLPGLASVDLALAIGEPPVETPSHRLGAVGAAVRTAQTRLAVTVAIDGLAALAGLRVELPLYVEVAYAEAQLADIRCYGGKPSNAAVSVDAVPGIAEIAIGKVDPSILSDFSDEARVERANLVDAKILRISGLAHVETKNIGPSRLTFSPSDIAAGKIKSVSTKDILTSTTQTLLNNLDVEIKVLMLSLGSPKPLQAALAQTLSSVTPQIDELLYNLLLLAGVRVGEADIRVTGVACQPAVLVQ